MFHHLGGRGCVLVLALAFVAPGCASNNADGIHGTDPKTSVSPSATPTTASTPSTTVSAPPPTPTPAAEPLSRFESRPVVRATRAYIEAVGRAVNAGDTTLSSVRGLATSAGLEATRYAFRGDLAHGDHWPGPEPYTPTAVRNEGGRATVSACMLTKGWSVRPRTGRTVGRHTVAPVLFEMRRVAGSWRFDALYSVTGDCDAVKVEEVRW